MRKGPREGGSPSSQGEGAVRRWLPREHGFWVMVGAAVLPPLLRGALRGAELGAAAGAVLLALLGARVAGSLVVRSEWAQLASSLGLPWLGVPVALIGGETLRWALAVAGLWSALFVAGSLSVRAALARGRRRHAEARSITMAAVAAGALALVVTAWLTTQGTWLAFAAAGLLLALAFAVLRPGPRQLRIVGLTLAGAALCATALVVSAA